MTCYLIHLSYAQGYFYKFQWFSRITPYKSFYMAVLTIFLNNKGIIINCNSPILGAGGMVGMPRNVNARSFLFPEV